jgi:hypothetical protein
VVTNDGTVTSEKHRVSTRVKSREVSRDFGSTTKIQPKHFAGSFKLAENKNYEKYQQELGVSWIKMKMGALLTPMEKIRLVFFTFTKKSGYFSHIHGEHQASFSHSGRNHASFSHSGRKSG